MNPKFSIIIPVYNVAPYLHECLDSVLSQTYADWEVICVDDGSTDGSGAILDDYSEKDSRFKIIHQKNGGVSSARNAGLTAADGDWVLFVDGDDVLQTGALQRLARIITEHTDLDAMQFRLKRFCEKEDCAWGMILSDDCLVCDTSGTFAGTPTYNFTCIAYRAALLGHIRFGGQTIGEDVLFLARFMGTTKKIGIIKDELYGYRVRPGSAMGSSVTVRKLRDKLDSIKNILNVYFCSQKFVPSVYWRIQCNALMEMMPYEWKFLLPRDRELIHREWENCLRELLAMDKGKIPARQRIRMRLVLTSPEFMVPLLCNLLYWLKAKGFHR